MLSEFSEKKRISKRVLIVFAAIFLLAISLLAALGVRSLATAPSLPSPSLTGSSSYGLTIGSLPKGAYTDRVQPPGFLAKVHPLVEKTNEGYFQGYGAAPLGGVYAVQGSYVVPAASCDPSNSNSQYNVLATEMDGYIGDNYQWTGIWIVCAQGSSTPQYYMGDSTGAIGADVNTGDLIFEVVWYSTSSQQYCMETRDFNTLAYLYDCGPTGVVGSMTDGEVVILLAAPCSTSSGVCPQVDFGTVETGYDYTGYGNDVFLANGVSYAYIGGFTSKSSLSYTFKFELTYGDLGTEKAGYYSKTGGLSSDTTSWTVTFKHE